MKKNILVVDDSALMRRVECDIINSDSNFQATDVCRDGMEAYEKLKTTSYDGVVLDVNMPRMDGLQLLEKLQNDGIKANVIMVSTLTSKDAEITILAMERGAIDFVTKPNNIIEAKGQDFRENLLSVLSAVLKTKSNSRVERRIGTNVGNVGTDTNVSTKIQRSARTHTTASTLPTRLKATGKSKIVALACSTGGPKALQSVIPYLPKNLDAPMVLVQHMPAGFTKSMADRLNEISQITVKEAQDGEILEKSHVYVAPSGCHFCIEATPNGQFRARLDYSEEIHFLRPAVDKMFSSCADQAGSNTIAVLLTGMGTDGADGCRKIYEKCGYTIAESERTSVVFGMPKAAIEMKAINRVLDLEDISGQIKKLAGACC